MGLENGGKEMFAYLNKVYTGTLDAFQQHLCGVLQNEEKIFVLTANPEMLMIAQKNEKFDEILRKESSVIVADGIGVIHAARKLSIPVYEKITGVELSSYLLKKADEQKKSIYLYGAKEEVVRLLHQKIQKEYQNIRILGCYNGYDYQEEEIFSDIIEKKPDIVLVALGIPRQEILIDKYYEKMEKGIFIGVGGSFDVISGYKRRAPIIFRKLNLEWLYRIIREPKRIKRFLISNVAFIKAIRKLKKDVGTKICQ